MTRRIFLLVAAVVLLDTAFYAAVAPLLPRYSDELDLSKTAAGILSASYAAGTLAGSLPGGWLAVRFGVKPTVLVGLTTLSLTSLVFGLANDIVLLDVTRFVAGFGGACSWAAGLAWLVGASPRERRGELIGGALAAAIFGVLMGPVLGGAATELGPEAVFGSVAALAAGLAGWALVTPAADPPGEGGLRELVPALRAPDMRTGVWLFTLPAIFAGTLEVLVPLRLDDLGASGLAVGAAFLVAAGFEASISPVVGRLSDRRGRLTPIRAGLAGAAVTGLLLPLPGTALLMAVMLLAVVVSLGTFWAPGMALLSDAAERAGLGQGVGFAVANLCWAVGQVIGGAGGSGLADATSDTVPYVALAALCALTLVTLARPTRRAPAAAA